MSEEKPVFKVTDRRLFNPDGTPREGAERPPEPPPSPPPVAESPAPDEVAAGANRDQPADAATADTATPAAVPTPPAAPDASPEAATGDTDPMFIELMMFVAENAAAMLSGHPQFGGEINLPYAKQFIDMLGTLQPKTAGRLSPEEQTTLEALLTQLRMQYVAATKAPRAANATMPPGAGGFTGGDITGGR